MLVEKAWLGQHKEGEELCGDRVLFGKTSDSVLAVLSDGMGTGVKANILATLTSKIVMTMLEGGATIEQVVETLGRTLPVCRIRKMAYSTFTILQIFNSGQVYVAEFDNPRLFALRHGKRLDIRYHVRPIGSHTVKEARWQGEVGDLLVVVSDGVTHAGIGRTLDFGWLPVKLEKYLAYQDRIGSSPETICRRVIDMTRRLSQGLFYDDTSIMALRLRSKITATIAVGPPVNPADDGRFVRELTKEGQIRVVCGGTTANIVARELGTAVQVALEEIDENQAVPPGGEVRGISLVTEGIITLTTVRQALQERHLPDQGNPAGRLARIMLMADSIRFLVGCAVNPAHQNPELPVGFSLKQQVIKEIAAVLEEQGKEIVLETF